MASKALRLVLACVLCLGVIAGVVLLVKYLLAS